MLLQWLITGIVIFGLSVAALLLLRRFFSGQSKTTVQGAARARQPRLGVVDVFELDRHRHLVLLRRDSVEHLVMIGGPNDVVVEASISRGPSARTAPSVDAMLERALQPTELGGEREPIAPVESRAVLPETRPEPHPEPRYQPRPQRSAPAGARFGESSPAKGDSATPSRSAPRPGDETVLNDMTRQLEEALKKPFATSSSSGAGTGANATGRPATDPLPVIPPRREGAPVQASAKAASIADQGETARSIAAPGQQPLVAERAVVPSPAPASAPRRTAPPLRPEPQRPEPVRVEARLEQKLEAKAETRIEPKLDLNPAFQAAPKPEVRQEAKAANLTAPIKLESAKLDAPKIEPRKADAAKPDVAPADAMADPGKSEAQKAEAAKGEAAKAELAKPEASKPEATKAESAKSEGAKAAQKAEPPRGLHAAAPKELDPFSPEAIEAEFARLLGRLPTKSDN